MTSSTCNSLFASCQILANKFREHCETVKIFASRCGGNLIEFDIAVRHAVRHLDSMHVRAGSRNRIIRSHKSRVCQCVAMHDACTRVCAVFYEVSLLTCSKTSSVPRRNGCIVQYLHGRFTTTCAHGYAFFMLN